MNGNKRLLIIAALLLLVTVSFGTYAIYKSSAVSSDSIRAAKWIIKANNTDIVASETFTLGSLDCGNDTIGQNGTIAPGDTCTATIAIDATGSEVAVNYTVAINTSEYTNSQLTVTPHSGSSLTGTIPYSSSSMTANVVLDVEWNAIDSPAQNQTDINTADAEIPVTVTVVQNPNPAS